MFHLGWAYTRRATKVAVAIVLGEGEEPVELRRWFAEEGDIRDDPDVAQAILAFIEPFRRLRVTPLSLDNTAREIGDRGHVGGSRPAHARRR